MNKFLPFISIFTASAMLLASGLMLHSVIELRATMRLDPELELLAIAYLKEERWRQQEIRRADAANRAAEQNNRVVEEKIKRGLEAIHNAPAPTFDLAPKSSRPTIGK